MIKLTDFSLILAISEITSCSQSAKSWISSYFQKEDYSTFLSIFISSSLDPIKKLNSYQLAPLSSTFANMLELPPIELTAGSRKSQRSLPEPDFPSSFIWTSSPCYPNILIKYVSNSFRGRNGNANRNWRQLISKENLRLVLHLCWYSCSSLSVSHVFGRRGRIKCFCRDYGTHHSKFSLLWSKSIQFLLHTLLHVSTIIQLDSEVRVPWIWNSACHLKITDRSSWNSDSSKCPSIRLLHRRNLDFIFSITRIQSYASWTSHAWTCWRRELSTSPLVGR